MDISIYGSEPSSIPTSTLTIPETTHEASLIYKLRTDEQHIRTLAVVLSLTGGLSLSFLLCVSIFIYWHCREFRRRGYQNSRRPSDKATTSIQLPTPSQTAPSPPSPTASFALSTHRVAHDPPMFHEKPLQYQGPQHLPALPPIMTTLVDPEPSAPPAKMMEESSRDRCHDAAMSTCHQCQSSRAESPPPSYASASHLQ